MNTIGRALVAAMLLGGLALLFAVPVTDAAPQAADVASAARGPLADNINNDDPDELCGSSNPRKRKKCHYNGWDLRRSRDNGNDNGHTMNLAAVDPSATGARVTVDGLSVELWKSSDTPVVNTPLIIVVKGEGAAIERVWWWAEGPVYTGPFADDLAFVGTQSYECGGAQPCAWTWPVTAKYLGPYMLHARVRDTSGREVQTDWKFETVETPSR